MLKTAQAKASNQPLETYAPIARMLLTMDDGELTRMRYKFEICYPLAKEGIAFLKYPIFHSLAEQQGVTLGSSYKGSDNARLFTDHIAEAQRNMFYQSSADIHFISFMMDGSTDSGNEEQDIIFVVYCKIDEHTKEIRFHTTYILGILNPTFTTAGGLLGCLQIALDNLDVKICNKDDLLGNESCPVLVGGGTDGASVNVGVHSGTKARMQDELPWLFWSWCFSHRLELACKNACESFVFQCQ